MSAEMDAMRRGGPRKCPRPCGVCEGGDHHSMDVCPNPDDPDDEGLRHEAYKDHDLLAWYDCKHCDAWVEDVDDAEDE